MLKRNSKRKSSFKRNSARKKRSLESMKMYMRGRKESMRKSRSNARVKPKRKSRAKRKKISLASKYLNNPTTRLKIKN